MKKIVTLVTAAALTLSLAACGQKPENNTEEKEKEVGTIAGVANPIHSGTKEEVEAATGISFIEPFGAEDIAYCFIDGSPVVAQMKFTLDGKQYTYRIASAAEDMDISGMYYDWEKTEQTTVGYNNAAILWNEEGTGLIRWYDVVPGLMYSLSMDQDASKDLLTATAALLFTPAQGDSDGETEPEEDYEAEVMKVLSSLPETVAIGTAGAALRAGAAAAKLADLFTAWNPEESALAEKVTAFAETLDEQKKAELSQAFNSIRETLETLLGENAKELLDACGYAKKAEWNADSLRPLFETIEKIIPMETGLETVIDQYRTAVEEKWDHEKLMEAGLNYMAADLEEDGCKLGYTITDLDNDGTDELLIAPMGDNEFYGKMIFALYRLDEQNHAVLIFQSGERDRIYYAGNASFAHLGSSGADDTVEETLTLNGGEMTASEEIIAPEDYVELELNVIE